MTRSKSRYNTANEESFLRELKTLFDKYQVWVRSDTEYSYPDDEPEYTTYTLDYSKEYDNRIDIPISKLSNLLEHIKEI